MRNIFISLQIAWSYFCFPSLDIFGVINFICFALSRWYRSVVVLLVGSPKKYIYSNIIKMFQLSGVVSFVAWFQFFSFLALEKGVCQTFLRRYAFKFHQTEVKSSFIDFILGFTLLSTTFFLWVFIIMYFFIYLFRNRKILYDVS